MPQPKLVSRSRGRSATDRGLENRLQRGPSTQLAGRKNAEGVREQIQPRTHATTGLVIGAGHITPAVAQAHSKGRRMNTQTLDDVAGWKLTPLRDEATTC